MDQAEKTICRVALNLALSENLRLVQKIEARFPHLEDMFQAPAQDLISLGIAPDKAAEIVSSRLRDRAAGVLEWAGKKGYFVLTIDDDAYPDLLRETFDPPPVLYGAGRIGILKEPCVAVVGARRPTPLGRAVAEKLSRDLASCGLVVVSGMAVGIDSLAHWGALKEGRSVAVLGSGLDCLYPRENRGLFKKIAEEGAVISEFPPSSPPLGFHFPLRNRIISGLSYGVVVVEASRYSGSLITARLALEQNREVMAVPGNITSDLSSGTNWLLKQGAKLVETWRDVVEEFPSPLRERLLSREAAEEKTMPELSPEEEKIFAGLRPDELTPIDEIVERSEASVSEVLTLLLSLELKGLVRQAPGKQFARSL